MKISFIPSSQFVADHIEAPKPARAYLPNWYKEAETGTRHLCPNEGSQSNRPAVSYKACMPFRDALTFGYIQETWCDLFIETGEGGIRFYFSTDPTLCGVRERNSVAEMPVPEYFNTWQMDWKMPWIPKLPKGWSVLVTSPLNRLDLPFTVTSGVIDGDHFHHSPFGMVPFYVRENFNGIIPAGTPMFQLIPFKRDNWKMNIEPFNEPEATSRHFDFGRHMIGHYRKSFWQPKRFT